MHENFLFKKSGIITLELADIIRSGGLSRGRDLRNRVTRERVIAGRDVIPTIRWCTNCNSECLQDYEGRVILAIGLNNALHGGEEPFVRFDLGNHEPQNAQVKILKIILMHQHKLQIQTQNKNVKNYLGFCGHFQIS